MDIAGWMRGALGDLGPGPLPGPDVVSRVPLDADYVTAGLVDVLGDAASLLGDRPGRASHAREVGWPPPRRTQPRPGLLVLADGRLRVLTDTGEVWSAGVALVTDLAAFRPTGFLLVTSDSTGLLASTQVPVRKPPGASWHTVGRITTVFGGWDRRLRPTGARIHG